jgi:hypothetical protein
MNKSSKDIKILKTQSRVSNIGEDGEELPPTDNSSDGLSMEYNVPGGTGLTVGFDFLGEYSFSIDEKPFFVKVVKSYDDLNP